MSRVRDHRPNEEEVRRLARLAGIELTDAEAARLRDDMAAIVDLVSDLPEVEEGAARRPERRRGGRLAEDDPAAGLSRELVLRDAPRHDGELILVPRVIRR
jgi:aspartyl/glutamyl-tRNA(Asn/Gln) amidotransferase C subunit